MKAVVLFPGVRYSCETSLLYFGKGVFESRGYHSFTVHYGTHLQSTDQLSEAIKTVGPSVLSQLKSMPLADCEDIVFLSKSVGTVLASWAAEQFSWAIRQFYLTPLPDAIPHFHPDRDYVVGGTTDPFMDGAVLHKVCLEQGIPHLIVPNVSHRLEDKSDVQRSIVILGQIVEKYYAFAH